MFVIEPGILQCCNTAFKRRLPESDGSSKKRMKYQHIRSLENEKEDGKSFCFVLSIRDGDELLWVSIVGVLVEMLIDSGCEKNIIDIETWKKLKSLGANVCNIRFTCDQNFKGYGKTSNILKVNKVFESTIEVSDSAKQVQKEATFYVLEDGTQPLLGRVTAKELAVLGLPKNLTEEICRLESNQKRPFPKIKGIQLNIPIDDSVTPIRQHARRPPLALLAKIEEKLNSLLIADIIEPVEEYSLWVSPLVTIVKDNGELRLCVDMRRANQAIKREAYSMPTFDDFLPQLKQARVFSRLDIKDAFHQLQLQESCRYITTFITHKGIFR
ncbi:uncharacterized protein K02A2.6-like [Wyeomyia smithii]|uniref:uncharacterized protein K02A2.6-like n=1 Tax=Wyeomyia smithii TaxID=174621 RepID=UPI002467CA41|nr:uncharacterized protein K02A2.6-like [Wyeomyia smithii]XP_055523035.1 uncharacterized protein K02A2.6-like [Wyeomyia smithii]